MADGFAAPPVNPLVSITPLTTPAAGRDATAVPPQLANVAPGTTVEGFVVNRDGGGNPIVRTVLGDILVKSDVFLKTGSEVVFRVEPAQPGAARILSIDGLEPQTYAQTTQSRAITADTVTNSTAPASTQSAGTPQAAARPTAPVPLTAVLVAPAPAAANATVAIHPLLTQQAVLPASLSKLQQGTQLKVTVLQTTLPSAPATNSSALTATAPAPRAASASATSNAPAPARTPEAQVNSLANAATARVALGNDAAPPPSPLIPTPASAALPTRSTTAEPPSMPGTATLAAESPEPAATLPEARLPHPMQAMQAYGKPGAPRAPSAPPQQSTPAGAAVSTAAPAGIPAQVIGHEKDGTMILHSPLGTLKMQAAQPLPTGSVLHLQVEKPTLPTSAQPRAISADLEQVTTLAQHWPALEETLAAAHQQSPMLARELAQIIPTIGPKLASGLLFFIAAARGGDVRQWLGNRAVTALEAALPELARRMASDMGQLQQLLVDSPLPQWNSVMVPLLHQGTLEHARLFFRHDQESEPDAQARRAGKEQRFILEVDLSQLGEVQFDGFVRQAPKAKQFDLVVRSGAALPNELTQKIRTTFDNAMQISGMSGYLNFQQGSQHFVRPMAEGPAHPGGTQPILA